MTRKKKKEKTEAEILNYPKIKDGDIVKLGKLKLKIISLFLKIFY